MNTPQLRNWSVGYDEMSAYLASEQIRARIAGYVYGHPNQERHPDGKLIAIATPAAFDKSTMTIRTASGSMYQLCEPDPAYLESLPAAKERLIEALEKLPGISGE